MTSDFVRALVAALLLFLFACVAPSASTPAHPLDQVHCRFAGIVRSTGQRLYRAYICANGVLIFAPTDCCDPKLPKHMRCEQS